MNALAMMYALLSGVLLASLPWKGGFGLRVVR